MSIGCVAHRHQLPAFGPWRDPERSCRAAVLTLAIATWASLVQLGWITLDLAVTGSLLPAVEGSLHTARSDRIAVVVDGLWYLALAAAAIAFLTWHSRVVRNTAYLGCERPEPSPLLAVVGWFAPFANLVVPPLSLLQIERWSRPEGRLPLAPVIGAWWTGCLLAFVLAAIAAVLHGLGAGTELRIAGQSVAAVAVLFRIAAAVLAVKLVTALSRRQQILATLRAAD